MGYFSNLAAEHVPYEHDHSYTPPDRQLLWRLEELEDRLHQLSIQKTGKRDEGVCFSESDLRYVLPEHFLSVSDVRKAIDLGTVNSFDSTLITVSFDNHQTKTYHFNKSIQDGYLTFAA